MSTPEAEAAKVSSTYVNNYVKTEEWVNTGTQEVMVFYPTLEEIADFPALIKKIEMEGAHLKSGICKIVPPKGWSPRPSRAPGDYSDIDDFRIYSPVKETIEGMSGCYTRSIKVHRKKMTVADFRRIAESPDMANPKPELSLVELEKYYWRSILFGEPIYGADSPGTLFDEDVKEFNVANLGTILDLLDELQIKISGVNTPFLYFGMWKTTFPWHVEDMDLYSINYLHFGEPKFWYAIPSQSAQRFERLACQQFPDGSNICKAFLRHKLYIISPNLLKSHSIPYGTMVQYPNEIVITFPKGYHMGFNVGYNCAEAINFALERWIDFGKDAVLCYCRPDGVEIDMQPFMLKYRPNEFKAWYDYWYGERQSSIDDEKSKKRAAQQSDPILDTIYAERNKRLAQAKRTVKNLWSTQPVNLYHEKEYNVKRSKIFPHCAVCQYFIPRRILSTQKIRSNLPKTSRRYITDQLFYKDADLPEERQRLEEDDLFQCANCHVVVHKRCYADFDGFDVFTMRPPHSPAKFLCVRCHNREDIEIRAATCALCELRGGALINMQNISEVDTQQQFVHVICALLHTGSRFVDPERRHTVHRPPPVWFLPEGVELDPENTDHKSFSPAQDENSQPCTIINNSLPSEHSEISTTSTSVHSETHGNISIASTSNDLNGTPTIADSCAYASVGDCNETFNNSTSYSSSETTIGSVPRARLTAKKSTTPVPPSSRYECEVCSGVSQDLIQCDVCVSLEENSPAASLRYHITCAPLADMNFERRNKSPYAVAVCPFHNSSHVVMKPDSREITEGERVIVAVDSDKVEDDENSLALVRTTTDGSLVGKGRVTKTTECLYCTVDFLDGTVSCDLYPCDVRRCECQLFGCKNGAHLPGSLVYILWQDGLMYEAYYRGVAPTRKYYVRLDVPVTKRRNNDSNSTHSQLGKIGENDAVNDAQMNKMVNNEVNDDVLELNQSEVFTLDEPLPEDVRLALLKRRSTTDDKRELSTESISCLQKTCIQ